MEILAYLSSKRFESESNRDVFENVPISSYPFCIEQFLRFVVSRDRLPFHRHCKLVDTQQHLLLSRNNFSEAQDGENTGNNATVQLKTYKIPGLVSL